MQSNAESIASNLNASRTWRRCEPLPTRNRVGVPPHRCVLHVRESVVRLPPSLRSLSLRLATQEIPVEVWSLTGKAHAQCAGGTAVHCYRAALSLAVAPFVHPVIAVGGGGGISDSFL